MSFIYDDIYACDWHGTCGRKPYREVFDLVEKPDAGRLCPLDRWEFVGGWSYLCFWHFQYVRMRTWYRRHILRRNVGLGWAKAERYEEDE